MSTNPYREIVERRLAEVRAELEEYVEFMRRDVIVSVDFDHSYGGQAQSLVNAAIHVFALAKRHDALLFAKYEFDHVESEAE